MKIVSLTIENFRAYKNPLTVTFNDLTVLIGKNDVGKSSILEALDIFFENRNLDKNDVNIHAVTSDEKVKLTVVFSNLPTEIDVDAGAKTNLKDEFLLNQDGFLEIKKEFSNLTKPKTYIICEYPNNDKANDLHNLKITDLQKRIKELNIQGDFKENTKHEMRKAIWGNITNDIKLQKTELENTQDGIKIIWDKISLILPIFALFQSDRKNDEKDKEIQDPLKVAAEQALKKHLVALNIIKDQVEKEITEIANLTVEKLKEMNEEVAKQLSTQFPTELKWHSLFTPTLTSDDIPMNKRGSGVRRLLLINFFRAEAERKSKDKNVPNVIYAIEEPETSQHPDWQQKLVNALQKLAESGSAQIITTTHSPSLASLIEVDDLRFIYKEANENKIEIGSNENLETIAQTLGVLPSLGKNVERIKVFLCLEGPTDIEFFNNISPLFDIDLKNDDRIVAISLGGGTLQHWVENNYLRKLNKIEVHIYDNDVAKYQKHIDNIIARNNNSWGVLTKKRELENYYHESIVIPSFANQDKFSISVTIDDTSDIPEIIAKLRHEQRNPTKKWEDQNKDYRGKCTSFVKKHLSSKTSLDITKDLLKQKNAFDEIDSWFNEIKQRLV
jgi:predicted ATP-dependent endonuclease of OLD family